MLIENVDILVIGAGPSGSVAASYLHKKGVNVKVVEKTKFPRIVVGESLIPRVMDHFAEADLFSSLDQLGFQKKPGARFIRGNDICIFDFSNKFSEGWDWTWQIPRADFDLAIANEMIKKGVDLEFESEVTHIEFQGTESITTVIDKNKQEKKIRAKFLIDASGYGRVLPRLLKLDAASKLSPHSAIFSHIKDVRRPNGIEGTQISFDILETKVWLWVIPFSNENTSVGIVGPTNFIEALSTNNSAKEALEKAISLSDFYINRFGNLPFEFAPIKLSNYSISVSKMFGDGYVLTGNSTEFLDPVFSSGVCFATESGMLAAKLAIKQINGQEVNWQKEYSDYMNKGIDVFTTYIQEWYTGNLQELFFHQPENPDVKRKICSVLAGYVWDDENPFVKKHDKVIRNMAHLIKMEKDNK
ncbi:NAD(P)/FAD-dependent oxidoreductase [Myroides pelagicus]|uniref:FAD-dependent oxidoreductase n=1 Tax=Myroides pelagicus TaxID=270914 RepID=A0A7K1GKT1_9FLAO|nr:NAD(P)/FAD-dependent oxidoreductase [Myroides pelagicus]MEC4113300.1 NAD(P)/FAD-dependent oxidoreductase [Myroides pelagicus]MTH29467.1 FAD-dependent oxidoreductase [Myroides pelagicus]